MGFWKRIVPAKVYDRIRRALLFEPDDPNHLLQVPPQRSESVGGKVQGYRYPAPGSQPQAKIPRRDNEDQLYDTKFYSRDPRNLPNDSTVLLSTSKGQTLLDLPIPTNLTPGFTSGMKIEAVAQYDPTGLRTATTANIDALNASLAQIVPDHLPKPEWWDDYPQMLKEAEAKGLPVPLGRIYKFKYMSPNYNKVRW